MVTAKRRHAMETGAWGFISALRFFFVELTAGTVNGKCEKNKKGFHCKRQQLQEIRVRVLGRLIRIRIEFKFVYLTKHSNGFQFGY